MKLFFYIIMKPFSLLFNFLFGIIAFFAMIFIILALTFNHWIPFMTPYFFRTHSGFQAKMEKSASNIFTLNFRFYDLQVNNGENFPMADFLKIKQFNGDFLVFSLLTHKTIVENFVLDIPELTYVRNGKGEVNLANFLGDIFGEKFSTKGDAPRDSEEERRPAKKRIFFRHVQLNLGRLRMMDYTVNPVRIIDQKLNYELSMDDVYADQLLDRLASDLKSRGLLIVMNTILNSLLKSESFADISRSLLRNGGGRSVERATDKGKEFLEKVKAIFK